MTRAVTRLVASAMFSALLTTSASDRNIQTRISPKQITLYRVRLVCPAAWQIGCGSRAKPILVELEGGKSVSEAWLNQQGTMLAVVWKPAVQRRERAETFKRAIQKFEFEARELTGAERKRALKSFLSERGNWLRGADVDRLSKEEAAIMAARLTRKIGSLITLADEKAAILQQKITSIIERKLTGELPDRSSSEEEILKVLRQELNEKDVGLLQEALKNYRPGQDAQ